MRQSKEEWEWAEDFRLLSRKHWESMGLAAKDLNDLFGPPEKGSYENSLAHSRPWQIAKEAEPN